MKRETAVIDKSLLQALCEQAPNDLDSLFNALLVRYQLVVPLVLIEEVWVNLANPGTKSKSVLNTMVTCLLHLQDWWIDEPLEMAFVELVGKQPIEVLPAPPVKVVNSFNTLRKDDKNLVK